jgi:hypothetical protein
MSSDDVVTEEQAIRVADAIAERFGFGSGAGRPQVYPGSHEGSAAPFVVSWEHGPFQWPYQQEVLFAVGQQADVYLEAVNHFALAVYPQ